MAKFFVSYSRSVKDEVRKVIDLLIASGHEVWWDGDIPVIADWWATILDRIEWCEVFIFVASSQSVQSAYCLAELKYASDRQRPILPFMLENPDTLAFPAMLPARGQWLLYNGDPAQMLTQINTACDSINWALHKDIRVRRPSEPLTGGKSLAKQFQAGRRLANEKKFEEAKTVFGNIKRLDYGEWGTECDEWLGRLNSYTPIVELVDDESTLSRARTEWAMHSRQYGREFDPHDIESKLRRTPSPRSRLPYVAIIAGIVMIGVLVIGVLIASSGGGADAPIQTDDGTGVVLVDTETPSDEPTLMEMFTPSPTDEPTLSPTLTDEPTPTDEPTETPIPEPLSEEELETQVAAQMAQILQEVQETQEAAETATAVVLTVNAQQTVYAEGTQAAEETEIALSWTPTPTPDLRLTAEARLTETAIAVVTQAVIDATATATLWTATPTNTDTPTATATPTNTATPTFTPTPDATATLIAFRPPTNDDWTPIEREFDGMEMVLVPAGCFMMGDDGEGDEQCFDEPFWIDKYEVTNAQYAEFIDAGGYDNPDYWTDAGWSARQSNGWTQPGRWTDSDFNGANQPVVSVSWYEAMAYAQWRGCRLPTEVEWEYAARGPDGLIYPWGDEFVADNLVYGGNSDNRTANVGSRPGGVSWVGALDMAGNVWNWTLSEFADYPYSADDGRENVSSSAARVVRGGSFGSYVNSARAAFRYFYLPVYRYGYNGLRVLCVPSSLLISSEL